MVFKIKGFDMKKHLFIILIIFCGTTLFGMKKQGPYNTMLSNLHYEKSDQPLVPAIANVQSIENYTITKPHPHSPHKLTIHVQNKRKIEDDVIGIPNRSLVMILRKYNLRAIEPYGLFLFKISDDLDFLKSNVPEENYPYFITAIFLANLLNQCHASRKLYEAMEHNFKKLKNKTVSAEFMNCCEYLVAKYHGVKIEARNAKNNEWKQKNLEQAINGDIILMNCEEPSDTSYEEIIQLLPWMFKKIKYSDFKRCVETMLLKTVKSKEEYNKKWANFFLEKYDKHKGYLSHVSYSEVMLLRAYRLFFS